MIENYQFQYPELASALYLALVDDAFYQVMEKAVFVSGKEDIDKSSDEIQKLAMQAYMDYSIKEAIEFGEYYIPEGEHYGVSVWSKPLSKALEANRQSQKSEFLEFYLGRDCLSIYSKACEFMSEQSDRIVPAEAWYLSIIGILPEFQGQGLGPGLVEPILEKTNEQQVGSFLETFTARNKTFYQRLGYQVMEELFEPTIQANYWLMYRPA